ncbi:nitroreductase [Cryomorphaceae bacterium 1068]|nr:nitroreductase [Cryomorphaceae bacterium 1068]
MRYNLSEITELIRNRRTIYPEQYTERVVQRDMLETILTNGLWAPTHGKTQPWRFKVYTGEGIAGLSQKMLNLYKSLIPEEDFKEVKYKRIESRIEKTSALVLLSMKRTPDTKIPELEEIEAVSCAAQNIMLTAAAYGLGTFWSSPKFLYTEEANASFGLDKNDKILGLFYFGYPSGDWPKSHRKPLEFVTEWIDG